MKANERFNQTIDTIEKLVVDPAMDARSIGEAAARKNGIAFRDLSTVFSFLMDTTLNNYVVSRKLNAAYRFLIHSETKRFSHAVEISDTVISRRSLKHLNGNITSLQERRLIRRIRHCVPIRLLGKLTFR